LKAPATYLLWKNDSVATVALEGRLRETFSIEPLPPDFEALAEALATAFIRHHATVAREPEPRPPAAAMPAAGSHGVVLIRSGGRP